MGKRNGKGKKGEGVGKRKGQKRDGVAKRKAAITTQRLNVAKTQDDARRRIEEKEAWKKELEGGEQTEVVKVELMDIVNRIAKDNEIIENAKVEDEKL